MAQSSNDTYNLERFVEAQEAEYNIALNEIKNGKKETHWMWYIFPQVLGLGFTSVSMEYGIKDMDEAAAYLNHPVLGLRLVEISNVLLTLDTNNAREIFGGSDAVKLRSSMTLFSLVPNADKVFQLVLDKFFNGKKDEKTLQLLGL
ncbi:DUF1810 domain-containing protein [Parafilimonas terrae]|jgi:uncharacterized protein (DUF1810 family)|uniref:Uncharacterized protein, DUF1810 family n=1 Tax=Parafilimonas terrae TaxID=1465490 RepID=A0A1I5WDU0_9BACT|nr:DUF1810 domain-containing protein [Parafilimonas terrae]SFQ17791.1 Uncharacterized protein, DUF1810 family [Parafilimonas terrae]